MARDPRTGTLDPLMRACGPRVGVWVSGGRVERGHLEAGTSVRLAEWCVSDRGWWRKAYRTLKKIDL